MGNATFLLVFNFSIGLSFATAFLALTWRSNVGLGRWFAAGFLAAASTVAVEAFAFAIPSVRLVSALSFGSLMLALTLITCGLVRHYLPQARIRWLLALCALAIIANPLVVFDLPRGELLQGLAYQLPFAALTAIAVVIILIGSRRRSIDLAAAAVLGASSAQFVLKAVVSALHGSGPGVRDYLLSGYAHYSQTAGGVLSLLLGLVLVGLVVTEVMAEASRRLQRDALSGALNRAAFIEQASELLRHTPLSVQSSVIMCDLDHFKSINDRFGHAAGDEVIRAFGETLIELTGEGGLCGRIGGEEFCVLLTDCSIAAARIYVDAIRQLQAMARYDLVPHDVVVTASFGVAITRRGEPIDAAMRRADLALYEAKAGGRDAYRFASLVAGPGDEVISRGALKREM